MKKILLLAAALFAGVVRCFAQTATVTPSVTTYDPAGGQITFTVTMAFPSNSAAVALSAKPQGTIWTHVSSSHVAPVGAPTPYTFAALPVAGATNDPADTASEFGWAYSNLDLLGTGGASFTFVLSYPAGLTGNQTIALAGHYRPEGGTITAYTIPAVVITPPVAPSITTQPANASVGVGANATFSVAVSGTPTPAIKWQRSTDNGATFSDLSNDSVYGGVTTATLTVTGASAAMNGHRFRAIATNTASPAATSSAATLTIIQAPSIIIQPVPQPVVPGSSASFSVTAAGTGPFAYQWYFTPTGSTTPQSLANLAGKISGAQTAALTVSNAQLSDVGDYVCVVSGALNPAATSNAALLSIVARVVRIVSQSASSGTNAVVPVQLVASGAENAVGFTINFDPTQLTYVSAVLGTQAADATLNLNLAQVGTGRLGIALAKPTNSTWAAGTNEILKVTFAVNAGLAGGTVSPLVFGDSPILREISDATANALVGGYQVGNVTVPTGFEADMNGNGVVSITDWVKVGRMVAGLDPVAPGIEFQKADCAGRATLGNGVLSISDWVQAGRYAAGLDPLTPAGGPNTQNP